MTPIDKHQPVPPEDRSAKLPEPGEDRIIQDLDEDSLNEAENELRRTVEREEEDREKFGRGMSGLKGPPTSVGPSGP